MFIWIVVCFTFFIILVISFLQVMSSGLLSYSIVKFHRFKTESVVLRGVLKIFFSSRLEAPKGLPELESVEQIAKNVTRVLGLNPGPHTLQGTNTYLIGTSPSKILVDTGEARTAKEYVSLVLDEVFPLTQTRNLSHILITHGHGDHQGGLQELFSELKKRNMTPLPTIHKYTSPTGSFPIKNFAPVEKIEDGETFETEGATLQAVYSPGHTDDHVCFILKENNALLSGDCILGCGTAVFEELHTYMKSLKQLRNIMIDGYTWKSNTNTPSRRQSHSDGSVVPVHAIYPAHGLVLSNSVLEKVDEYITHREERERQILEYLRLSSETYSSLWKSSWEIMSAIYPTSLHILVKVSAQHNVQHHLSKLETDGKVSRKWPDMWCYHNKS